MNIFIYLVLDIFDDIKTQCIAEYSSKLEGLMIDYRYPKNSFKPMARYRR